MFKFDFHRVYIQARKNSQQKWYDLLYLVTDHDMQEVIKCWMKEWCAPLDLDVGTSKGTRSSAEKKRKDTTK